MKKKRIKRAIIWTLLANMLILNTIPVCAAKLEVSESVDDESVSENILDFVLDVSDDVSTETVLNLDSNQDIYALIYNTKACDVYDLPSVTDSNNTVLTSLPVGQQVKIVGAVYASNQSAADTTTESIMISIETNVSGRVVKGYIDSKYIVTNDAYYNEWYQNILNEYNLADSSDSAGLTAFIESTNTDNIYYYFPTGYWDNLIRVSNAHPNWVFVPMNTGLDWNTVVAYERAGNRSLVYKTSPSGWKSDEAGDYDASTGTYISKSGANWFRASDYAVQLFLNPINYLDETHVFAFEQLTFNSSIHNASGVDAIIQNSWMYNRPLEDGSGGYYRDVFMDAANQTGVSPYHLASRVLQEQGINGSATLISGYGGVYNYFNVKASGNNEAEILANGTAFAQSQGWYTRYASIVGGARRLGENYITQGQDSLYLEKFDVEPNYFGLFEHQYMQNIQAPYTESEKVYEAYASANALGNTYVFQIPVYENMPGKGDNPLTKPTVDEKNAKPFITRLYETILDRSPDPDGMETWLYALQNGKTGADLVAGFFYSGEMQRKNLDNEAFVEYAYRAILGREADTGGKEFWTNELNLGCTRAYILSGFVGSGEFGRLCDQYGITVGTLPGLRSADKNPNQAKFITRLYHNILGRGSDEEGLYTWTDAIEKGMSVWVKK